MKVLLINSVCGIGSTGKICAGIAEQYEKEGHEVKIAYGRSDVVPEKYQRFAVRIGSDRDTKLHAVRNRLLDDQGFGSVKATRQFLRWAEEFDPDEVWLHNLHGYYINIELLFQWIKSRPDMRVKWTLHDCWAFTGHCAFFTYAQCSKWESGCQHCAQKKAYPASLLRDNSKANYQKKRALFTGVRNLTLITPSQWLADLVKKSFLREYPVEVIYNTIDTEVFKPTPSDFRKKNGLENKKIILGVCNVWEPRKGLGDFVKLSALLDESAQIVLVGLTPKEAAELPQSILSLPRTNSVKELAEIYTAADVLFNPTYEDNYPTVNLEAEACGTRVLTYATGGCAETVHRPDSVVIPVGGYAQVPALI